MDTVYLIGALICGALLVGQWWREFRGVRKRPCDPEAEPAVEGGIGCAVAQTGTVSLAVPAQQTGAGKVTLTFKSGPVEYQAVTRRDGLSTGERVLVVGVVAPNTVEVIAVSEREHPEHQPFSGCHQRPESPRPLQEPSYFGV
ncbi:MAG TPA: hypothetical protein VEL76_24065 [Gemmataceae bacterium]|nr:hypothetical protein [Gemmataceae bacterium]